MECDVTLRTIRTARHLDTYAGHRHYNCRCAFLIDSDGRTVAGVGVLNPLSHLEFEVIFGTIMTLLIAMEFNHSILETMNRFHRIIQVRTVVLVGILALVRKFIIVNIETTSATTIGASAFAVIALGALYWLIGESDKRAGAVRHKP